MASDPKKPRLDEQTRAEERPHSGAECLEAATIVLEDDGSIEFSPAVVPFAQTFASVAAVLEHCRNLREVDIEWAVDPDNVDFRLMRRWMQVASKLHALPSLSSIEVSIWFLQYPFADFVVASLPDRLTHADKADLRTATLLRKRATPLASAEFRQLRDGEHSRFADVFRTNSARIELKLRPDAPRHLHALHDCGPLERNDRLQELHVSGPIVADGGIPQALGHLRDLNEHFELLWQNHRCLSLQGLEDLERVVDVAAKATEFAAAMGAAGFRSPAALWVSISDENDWQHVSRDAIFERLQWERVGAVHWPNWVRPMPTCSLVQDGVRILIGLY